VVGVSFDTVGDNRAFARKYEFDYPLLSDPDRTMGLDYHAASDPDQATADRITYLIAPDGTIAGVWEKVDVKTHPAEVLAAIGS
jgi:peroxiredoxin Q/BCP